MNISSQGPFMLVSEELNELVHHPDPALFKSVVLNSTLRDRQSLVRLWLTEGIPFAFRANAGIYEEMRAWMAERLSVHAKDITLLGSGRIGFSLKPEVFGRAFGLDSDLDLSIVNFELFNACRTASEKFADDFANGNIVPVSNFEKNIWTDSTRRLPNLLRLGFVDPYQIPIYKRYAATTEVNNTMARLLRRLKQTPGMPNPRKVSSRVYRDWDALVTRVSFNLESAKKKF